jgi:hypothetical protein
MDFIQGDAVFLGTCTDLSETGLRGTFSEYVAPRSEGLLTLYHGDEQSQMRATVYSIRDGEVRIRFNFASDKERAAMSDLVKLFISRAAR